MRRKYRGEENIRKEGKVEKMERGRSKKKK